jgi:hypothetical protein
MSPKLGRWRLEKHQHEANGESAPQVTQVTQMEHFCIAMINTQKSDGILDPSSEQVLSLS